MAPHPRVSKSSSVGSLNDVADAPTSSAEEPVDLDQLVFTPCHSGPGKQHEVKGLQPWTTYHFRVQVRLHLFLFEDVFTDHSSAPFLPLFFRRLTLSDSAASLRWLPSPRWLPHQPPFPVYDVLPSQLPASVSLGTLRIAMALPSRTTMWKSETEELYPLTMHRPHLMSIT